MGSFSDLTNEALIDNQRWTEFHFLSSGGVNGAVTFNVTPNKKWRLEEVRIHVSSAFASVEDLTVRISSIYGSANNALLRSQAMLSVTDLFLVYDPCRKLLSDDDLIITLSLVSGTNTVGIEVTGWAALG